MEYLKGSKGIGCNVKCWQFDVSKQLVKSLRLDEYLGKLIEKETFS